MKKLLVLLLVLALLIPYGCKKNDKTEPETKNTQEENQATEDTKSSDEKESGDVVVNDDRYAEEFTEKEHGDTLEEGKPSPDFTLKNFDGEEVKLDQFLESGEMVLFNFFATTWPYCVEEMPNLVELDKRDDVKVVFVNLGQSPDLLKEFMKNQKIDMPVFFDEKGELPKLFLFRGIPSSVFIDGDGIYHGMISGLMSLEQLEKTLDTMLGK